MIVRCRGYHISTRVRSIVDIEAETVGDAKVKLRTSNPEFVVTHANRVQNAPHGLGTPYKPRDYQPRSL